MTLSVRVEKETAETFRKVCEKLKINTSDFLRGCCLELITNPNPEEFLKSIGFVKQTTWLYEKKEA